jgi:hypothetical protein
MTSGFYEALFDTRLSKGREAVSDFETTSGGYRLSTSIGGVLTGRGADIIIIDDPLKADDALSEPRRKRLARSLPTDERRPRDIASQCYSKATPICSS